MITTKIIQKNNLISIIENFQQNQFSDGMELKIEFGDSTFDNMAIGIVAANEKDVYELEYDDVSNIAIIPSALTQTSNYIYISIYGTDASSVITSNVVHIFVNESNKLTGVNAPNIAEWQQLSTQLTEQYIEKNVNPKIKKMTDEAIRQQEVAVSQQNTAASQQNEVHRLQDMTDNAIASMNTKLDDGTFIPEHKWENTTLYFKHSDGSWDDGVNLADEIKKTCPFPIGFVLTSGNANFDPNKEYSETLWERIKGRVIVGVDEDDEDFNGIDKTGGTKSFNNQHSHSITHTHTINGHTHTTGSLALTEAQIPLHNHEFTITRHYGSSTGHTHQGTGGVADGINPRTGQNDYVSTTGGAGSGQSHNHGSTGSSGTLTTNASSATNSGTNGIAQQSILQPYIVKYIWERIA